MRVFEHHLSGFEYFVSVNSTLANCIIMNNTSVILDTITMEITKETNGKEFKYFVYFGRLFM